MTDSGPLFGGGGHPLCRGPLEALKEEASEERGAALAGEQVVQSAAYDWLTDRWSPSVRVSSGSQIMGCS